MKKTPAAHHPDEHAGAQIRQYRTAAEASDHTIEIDEDHEKERKDHQSGSESLHEQKSIQNQQELFEQGQDLPALNDENTNDFGSDPSTQDLDIPELMEEINNDDYESINNDEAMMDDYSAILN